MKKGIFSIFAAALALTSCSDDDNGNNANITVQALTNTITNQTWRVTSFTEDGIDHTSDFTGYNFTFDDNNTVSATNGTNTYSGIWTITEDDDDSDDNVDSSNPDFYIMFAEPETFTELTEDWDPIERTGNKVRLRHVSGGDGGTDYLTFERNAN
jgi:hypothetical protein